MHTKIGSLFQSISTRLINRRFLKASGLLLLANIIVTALGLIRTPAITWLIPKDQVGMIGVVASWLPFVSLVSYPGLDVASHHYMAKGQRWAFVINITQRLKWSFFSSGILLAGAIYWVWRGETGTAWLFVITALTFPVTIGLSAATGALSAQERFKDLFWYRIWESITDFAGFIPLLISVLWVSQVVTFYTANQLATAIMMIIYSLWIWRQLRTEKTPPLAQEDQREMMRYGKHQTALNIISVLQTRTDALLVGARLPLTVMADYSIALLIYEQLKRLWIIYQSVRYPPLVRLPRQRRLRRMAYESILVTIAFLISGVALFILAGWLIPILLPSNYTGSLAYLPWLVASFVSSVPGFFAEVYFRTEQDEKNLYKMRVSAAIIGVILPTTLILAWGVTGVLIGRLAASLTYSLLGGILTFTSSRRAGAT